MINLIVGIALFFSSILNGIFLIHLIAAQREQTVQLRITNTHLRLLVKYLGLVEDTERRLSGDE